MTKAKLNIIKLNIITVILTLICISCAPLSKIDPKVNESTNSKKSTNPEKNIQNPEDLSGELGPSDQELLKTTILELKEIGKELEDQRKEEDTQMAKIVADNFDFLDTFKVDPRDIIEEDPKTKIKRIIYSSLDYEKEKIDTLKKILEKLKENSENHNIVGRLIHHISWATQFRIEKNLASIKNTADNLHLERARSLLAEIKSDLKIKQRLKKTLNETIEAYKQDDQGIKNDEVKLAEHFNQYYKNTDTLRPLS
ncbi:complement regulator-acquiring protein (plasmid) [Borreliella carolinensis]|uniref:complement regulator-acquiring protein n=1 Tax=Borreliella carolinensis TaxID=478174 RepID=UPI0029425942|nr:complement regulator-acquiring protein [Borreliella carolinensis]WNY63387.1 complement regulator-acquiring protein [Borreliella carolinensis]WNY65489.1 complement regulator-acquiring protein [Borreliella carolinensis]